MATALSINRVDYKDCIFHEKIGEGGFGTVNRITFHTPYNGYKEAAGKSVFNLEESEIKVMSQLHHEHIVKLIGFSQTGPIHVILMECATNGSLHEFLSDTTKPLPIDLKHKWATESALALQYLHGKDYLHRDIKSSNCLLFDDNLLKLCDFGLARKVEHSQTTSTQKGTYKYMAPEIVVGNEQGRAVFSKPGDLYAYGMLLLEIYTRKPPFPDWEWIKVVYEVGNGAIPTIPSDCPDHVSRIMRECWKTDPKDRPTIESVLEDLLNTPKEATGTTTEQEPLASTTSGVTTERTSDSVGISSGETVNVSAGLEVEVITDQSSEQPMTATAGPIATLDDNPRAPKESRKKTNNKDALKPVKMVLVGNGAVGKTYMLHSFITDEYPTAYVPTVFDNYSCQIYVECQGVNLGIFDTAGQGDYDRLRPQSYPGTDIFLVCFSVVSPSSYEDVRMKWMPEVRHYAKATPCLLVGTKLDLREDEYEIAQLAKSNSQPLTKEDGERMRKELGAVKYIECSALTQENLKLVFGEAVKIVFAFEEKNKRKRISKKRCLIL